MTDHKIALRELLETGSDASFLREMIGFAAGRLMALETEELCGPAPGERPAERRNQRNGDADEIPQQLDRPWCVLPGQPGRDRHPQMVGFLDQRLARHPIDEGAGAADGLDPLVDFGGELAWPLGAGEQHAQLLA